jgi:alkyl sulfatase BDS1-like metallo-beta-lactamase superfamily hydrolase
MAAYIPNTWIKTAVMVALLCLAACSQGDVSPLPQTVEASAALQAHSAQFRQEVVQVLPGIHVAIGYGLANSILIEGRDGLIIVDAMESAEAAEAVKSAFARISTQPVKALIYTHFHSDHIGGGRILAGNDRPEVYCHAETLAHMNRTATVTRETTYRRAMRQFGTLLPEGGLVNAGIGPRLEYDETKHLALLPPTQTFAGERLDLDIAGVKLVLMHAPGETPDQMIVWLPEQRVLLPADNFYHSFPNLYAIRGTAYRDVMLWVKSLDRMRALPAAYLIPQHTRPIVGEQKIYKTLTDYRDAIQFVHDQTIRWMNRGLTPEAIVERVRLPEHLAAQPYLQEYYGTVAWSIRAIFDGYLGWFGGNATDLFPLGQPARAERFAALAGGQTALLDHARKALADGDYQWSLELTDQLLRLDPSAPEVRQIKADALRALGHRQTAATARNYYLTQALEVEQKLTIGSLKISDPQLVHSVPLAAIFEGMAVKLDPEKSAGVDLVAGFRFPDTGEAYTVHVRRGVAEIRPEFPENPAIAISIDSNVWKEIAAGARSPAVALVTEMDKEGGTLDIVRFLSFFKAD